MVIRTTGECRPWMHARGVRFQQALGGTLSLARTNAFFLGGGKALVNSYYRTMRSAGVEICYEASVEQLCTERDRCTG